MTWILASVLLIAFSATLYLGIRKAQAIGITLACRNFLMFGLPAVLLGLYNVINSIGFVIEPRYLMMLIGIAFFFCYLGNLASLIAIENAPNPGYSLIISKSYVVLTTFISPLLFASQLTQTKVLAIAMIVVFSSLILIEPKATRSNPTKPWVWFTFAALLAWTGLALVFYWLVHIQNLRPETILFYIFAITALFILAEIHYKKASLSSLVATKAHCVVALAIGVSATLFNIFILIGYQLAPNPGFINAANSASIFLVAILSSIFFKDALSKRKALGILGVLGGLGVLFFAT